MSGKEQKFKKNSKEVKVREIRAEAQATPEATVGAVGGQERASPAFTKGKAVKTQPPVTHADSELLDIIKQLKGEVEEIKKVMFEPPRSSVQQRASRRRACRTCQDNNKGEQCNHCFKCGQSGHLSRGCRMGRRNAEKPGTVEMSANTVTAIPTPPADKDNQNEQFRDMYKLVTDRIQHLESEMAAKTQNTASQKNEAVSVNLISPKQRAQLLSLVGRKYIITCLIDGVETKALWDTGSQVSLMNEKWRQQQIPHATVRDLAEIVEPDLLNARAVNQTPIPFSGWVEVTFKLPSENAQQLGLRVPVLVSDEDGVAEQPIIGYNVIEYVLARGIEPPCVVTDAVSAAFSFDCNKTEVFLKVMRSGNDGLGEGTVKMGREITSIPAGQTKTVKCSVRAGTLPEQQDVSFEPCPPALLPEGLKMKEGVVRLQRGSWSCVNIPVTNSTTHDILLPPRTILFPDFKQQFTLHCDASQEGLGAVLYQRQQGKLVVVAYGSRTLTAPEKNYHLHSGKLEFLAMKWAICERFRDYLFYSPPFTVYTDNNPLTYVLTTAKLNATTHRWVAELADFQFSIKYRPGRVNGDADGLSRMPMDMEQYM